MAIRCLHAVDPVVWARLNQSMISAGFVASAAGVAFVATEITDLA